MSTITQKNNTEPATPSSGSTVIYPDATSKKLTTKNDAGLVTSYASEGQAELAKVSANDTTANYLESKIVAGSNVTITTLNDGANETLSIAATAGGGGTAPFPVLAARIFVGNYYRTGLGAIAQANKAANVFTGGFYVPQESFVAEEIGPQPSAAADVMAKVGVYKLTDPSDPYTWELVAESGQFSCNTTAHVFDPLFEVTFLKNEIYAVGVTPNGVVPLRDFVSGGGINLGQGLGGSQGNSAGESLGFNAGAIGDSLPASVTVAGLGQRPTMVWWKVKSLV